MRSEEAPGPTESVPARDHVGSARTGRRLMQSWTPAATGLALGNELAPALDGWRRATSWERVTNGLDRPVRIRADVALPARSGDDRPVTGPDSPVEHGRFWPGVIVVGRGYVAACHRTPRRSHVVRGASLRAIDDGPRTEWGWNRAFAGDVRLPDRMAHVEDDHGTYAVVRIRDDDVQLLDNALSASAERTASGTGRPSLLPLAGYPRIWLVMTAVFTSIFWLTGVAAAVDGEWDVLLGAAVVTAAVLALGAPWLVRSWSVPWIPGAAIPVPTVPTTRDPWSRVGIPPHASTLDAPDETPARDLRPGGWESD